MRLGILTQPLVNNYGGLLQNYALQTVLRRMGHSAVTINLPLEKLPYYKKFGSCVKRSILKYILSRDTRVRAWPTVNELKMIQKHTVRFVNENIVYTDIRSLAEVKLLEKHCFDGYVVGSDQVWRPFDSPRMPFYLLDFVKEKEGIRRIAYAASFGIDNWHLTSREKVLFTQLLQKFDAVSVREDSAVSLCKEHFNVEVVHLLDPTMLLETSDYIQLVDSDEIGKSAGDLLVYVLDATEEKQAVVNKIAQKFSYTPFSVMPKRNFDEPVRNFSDCMFPPVTTWLRGFMDAKFVVTDSFHGTIFSLIFNKPFIAIGNATRGLTRFNSLLKMFDCENRLLLKYDDLKLRMTDELIDFQEVNSRIKAEQLKSHCFLQTTLKSNEFG